MDRLYKRAVTPTSLCGMEDWEVDFNDPDLFANEQKIHMAEVLGDDSGCRESGVESDAADSRSHEQPDLSRPNKGYKHRGVCLL